MKYRLDIRADYKKIELISPIEPILKTTWLLRAVSKDGLTARYQYITRTEPIFGGTLQIGFVPADHPLASMTGAWSTLGKHL